MAEVDRFEDVTVMLVNTKTWHAGPFTLRMTDGNDYAELNLSAKVIQPGDYRLSRRDLVALLGLVTSALTSMTLTEDVPEVSHRGGQA
jgi:hypothetical protein